MTEIFCCNVFTQTFYLHTFIQNPLVCPLSWANACFQNWKFIEKKIAFCSTMIWQNLIAGDCQNKPCPCSRLVECHEDCACSPKHCQNRVVQSGPHKGLYVENTTSKGLGLFCQSGLSTNAIFRWNWLIM